MDKILTIIIIITLVAVVGLYFVNQKSGFFGQQLFQTPTYFDTTNTSSSAPTVVNATTTTGLLLSLDAARTNTLVCNLSNNIVFLHRKGQATTTGIRVNEGVPLYATSTGGESACKEFPGFKGYLYGISTATSAVSISTWK